MLPLLNMLQVCDSLFPIGAFTLSNGLESFVQSMKVSSIAHLAEYLDSMIELLAYNELGFFFQVYKYGDNEHELIELDNLYGALKIASEVRHGSEKLCQRFLKNWAEIEELESFKRYSQLIKQGDCDGHHVILMGLFVREKLIDIDTAATLYAYSIISNIVTNATKSVPLSQLKSQAILNGAFSKIEQAIKIGKNLKREELGVGGIAFDIYAMKHETLYSRLYMS